MIGLFFLLNWGIILSIGVVCWIIVLVVGVVFRLVVVLIFLCFGFGLFSIIRIIYCGLFIGKVDRNELCFLFDI